MHVTVRLFASLRDLVGTEAVGAALVETFGASEITVTTLRAHLADRYPALRPHLERVAIAVNEEYVIHGDTLLHDGDTVALIPPISGGGVPTCLVTREPLDGPALRDLVLTPASGAVVLFDGTVRDHHEGRAVLRLEYEAYEEMATRQLQRVVDEVLAAFAEREVHRVAIHHRIGTLGIGETSLLVAVSAAHRADAFAAAERAVDRVKETVPVWKKEWGPDGSHWQEGITPRPLPNEG